MKTDGQIRAILDGLTLDEKASLTGGTGFVCVAGVPEKGIPPFRMIDGPQGVRMEDGPASTALPCGIALACTFDPETAREYGALIGRECAANDYQAILGPGINLMRTPLNGRNFEYYGEDPVLSGEIASGYVRGCQSEGVAACPKHLALNNQEICRTTGDSRVDERTLQELYLRAFEIVTRTAFPWLMMSSYNKINGTQASACHHVQQELVKDQWGFDGVMVSDWGGSHDTIGCALGGEDLEMPDHDFLGPKLAEAVRKGMVPESIAEEKAERILRLYQRTGLLEGGRRPAGEGSTKRHHELAMRFAERGSVLLKNRDSFLPLNAKKLKKLAVIGPSADKFHCIGSVERCGGSGAVHPEYEITVLAGLKEYLKDSCTIRYERGTAFVFDSVIPSSLLTDPDGKPGVRVEYFETKDSPVPFRTDTAEDTAIRWGYLNAAGMEHSDLDDRTFFVRISGFITPDRTETVGVSLAGSLSASSLKLNDVKVLEKKASSLFSPDVEIHTEAGKKIRFEIELEHKPGRADISLLWHRDGKEDFDRAVEAAAWADAVIYVGGTHHSYDKEALGWGDVQGADIPDLELPDGQAELISAVAKANTRTAVVLINGSVVNTEPWIDSVAALLECWYPGMEGGHAVARMLFGDAEPEGRLCCTWGKKLTDYSCHANGCYPGVRTGDEPYTEYKEGIFIGYRHFEKRHIAPRFPFGYGLGYTTVRMTLDRAELQGRRILVTVSAENTGSRPGCAVAQIYTGNAVERAEDPVKELKRFHKFHLAPGEKQQCVLTLDARDLAVFDPEKNCFVTRPGKYRISLGASVQEILGEKEIFFPEF